MSSKVEVLCPTGHRINVKTTQGTTILQILEEVCTKKDFLPPDDYELKHGKKVLDVTMTVRYAGLPNLAKLELMRASKPRQSSMATIAIQTASGERLQKEFRPDCALWDILTHWENDTTRQQSDSIIKCNSGEHPVCIYMREEIIGEYALRETTLKKLGLTSGKAIIRIVQRSVSEDVLVKIKDSLEQEKARLAKIAARAVERQNSQCDTAMSDSTVTPVTEPNVTAMEVDEDKLGQESNMEMEQDHKDMSGEMTSGASAATHSTGARPKDRPVPVTQAQPGGTDRPVTVTQAPPEGTDSPDDNPELTHQQEKVARQLAQHIMPGIFPDHDAGYEARQAELERLKLERRAMAELRQRQIALLQAQIPTANFKFPEETKGKDLYRNELSNVDKTEYQPCDRECVLYTLEEPRQGAAKLDIGAELSDDFFEITEADVRNMWHDLQRQAEGEANAPMMTKAMRKAQLETNIMAKYDRVVIRIHFPDKYVMQGLFRPKETVFALERFVREHLDNKNISFYLYTAPPKVLLKDNAKTLIEAKLAPMSIVYFGSNDSQEHYLSSAVIKEVSCQGDADKIIVKHMPGSRNAESALSTGEGSLSEHADSGKRQVSPGQSQPGKVPKWFKLGGKK